jgi:hypothetical protein
MGFRLAYPQRGNVFLDVLPPAMSTPSNVVEQTTNSLTVTYNILPVYPAVTVPAYTNVYHTDNLLYTLDGAVSISNRITTNQVLTTVTNVFSIGGSDITVTGTVGRTTSNLYQDATSVTLVTNTAVAPTPQYFQHTNYVLGVTSIVQVTTSREYLPLAVIGGTTNYSTGASLVQNSTFTSSLDGWSAFDENGNTTDDIFWSLGRAAVRGTGTIQQVVSGLTIGERYVFSLNASAANASIVTTYKYGDTTSTLTGSGIAATSLTAAANSLVITISSSTIATNQTVFYDDVSLRPAITNRFVDTAVTTLTATAQSFTTPYASIASATTNQAFSITTNIYNLTTFSVARSNMPPDGPYFAEVLTYSGSSPTNATQSRTLAKGQVTIENSIWSVTNYAGYTNYPGPWDYLLQDGSRPMAGNFNAGGYGVTNIGSPYIGFQDGTYISPSNVALWNSFIQGTSVALTVSTEFDGNVTGVWNNLTLRKNVLDEMQFLDLTTTPTGTPSIGRMVWDADRETIQVGLDAALDLDIGQQQFALVKNAESVTISNGVVVYLSGASGDKATVKIASYSNDFLSARTMGIAAEDIGPNGVGYIVTRGPVYNQNTAAFTAGAVLYLGAYGNLTTNRPAAPLHGVFIGVAEKINSNAGVIYVAIQNGFELDELHDVNIAAPATNDLLIYNGTVWTNYARTNLSAAYLPLAGGTMSGNINMDEYSITNISGIGPFGSETSVIEIEGGVMAGPWTFTSQPTIPGYLTSTGAAATYLPLAGGTMTGPINMSGELLTGTGGKQIDFDVGEFTGAWSFNSQPTIPGYINTNNLSTIAGSGLAVSNNQLVVTNVAGTFESLTGNQFSLGNSSVTNISVTATGAFVAARVTGTSSIGDFSYGASQQGLIIGSANIQSNSVGSKQIGAFSGVANIEYNSYANIQRGVVSGGGNATIQENTFGASQIGYFLGNATIGITTSSVANNAHGALQIGTLYGTAVNEAKGAIQIMGDISSDFGNYYTTENARGSLLVGPGTNSVAYSVKAAGGFYGNASGLTNFPSSILTVSAGNANYWRITTAPTGATASGSSGQLAVSGTNLYIYSPNALGVGTARASPSSYRFSRLA